MGPIPNPTQFRRPVRDGTHFKRPRSVPPHTPSCAGPFHPSGVPWFTPPQLSVDAVRMGWGPVNTGGAEGVNRACSASEKAHYQNLNCLPVEAFFLLV